MESSHITYSAELHWRTAAKWSGIMWDQFIELDGDEMSRLVAVYETAMQIEAVMARDAQRQATKKNRRGHHGS